MGRNGRALSVLLRNLPVPLRHALIGAVTLGALGALVGLVLGLRAYVPTAWAAMFEVAIPAAFLGAVLGLVAGSVIWFSRRARVRRRHYTSR